MHVPVPVEIVLQVQEHGEDNHESECDQCPRWRKIIDEGVESLVLAHEHQDELQKEVKVCNAPELLEDGLWNKVPPRIPTTHAAKTTDDRGG